ncbi:MAG: hypothetical protein R3B70_01195 [Polyangiaceae bacterium]
MTARKLSTFCAALGALILLGADGDGCSGSATVVPEQGTTVRMDMAAATDFYAAPFPSEHRRRADGTIEMGSFPNPNGIELVTKIADIVGHDADGFGTTSGIYFSLTDALDPASLPVDMRASTAEGAGVFLVSVDAEAPDFGQRYPVKVGFEVDGGPFGAPNLLAMLPYQGVPLRPGTLYAAVVRTSVHDAAGKELSASRVVQRIAAGLSPEGMSDASVSAYRQAIVALAKQGVSSGDVAGLSVFRTGHPDEQFGRVVEHLLSQPMPAPEADFEPAEVFDDFCVYHTTIKMPTYQSGTPPYDTEGGGWAFDADGNPVVQANEEANFVVTLPRGPMPAEGFPVVVFSRTGAGGERPLVDRGVRATPGGEAVLPGTGPAMEFAKVGFAGSQIDGPHGGLRNVSGKDEQFLVFNVFNPLALRDNVRQSAVELVLQAHLLETIQIDASACPGLTTPNGGKAHFDVKTMAAFGHSMGASIAPLSMAFEPRLRAAILSGAGSSYLANILYKKKPIEAKAFAELLLQYVGERELTELDPVMTLLQWAAEPADTQAYARRILREPVSGEAHHILMVEGVVDRYIMPPIANSTALCLGLDLAGEGLDAESEELSVFAPLASVLDLSGGQAIDFPATGNIPHEGGSVSTAVVVQHEEDGIEDGHEAVFQREEPKHQYRCFLQTFAKGQPTVPAGAGVSAPCD